MIIAAIINWIFDAINLLVAKLPDVATGNPFLNAVGNASGYMASLDIVIPVGTLLSILTFYVIFEAGYLTFKVIYWIIRRFPTQS